MKKLLLFGLITIGIWTKNIAHAQWIAAGLSNEKIYSLAVKGNAIFAGTDRNGIFLSNDNGSTWTSVKTNLTVYSLAIKGSDIYAGTRDGGIFRSSDNGSTWTFIGLPKKTVTTILVSSGNIYAATSYDYGKIYLSTDNGATWNPIVNGLTLAGVTHSNVSASLTISGSNLFAGLQEVALGSKKGGVFISKNNGGLWTSVLADKPVNTITTNGNYIYTATINGLFVSSDNGSTWKLSSAGLTNAVSALYMYGSNVFAGTYEGFDIGTGGVFYSTNNGNSWILESAGLVGDRGVLNINSFNIVGTTLLAGTGSGVFKRPLSEFSLVSGVQEPTKSRNSVITLYPNPVINDLNIKIDNNFAATQRIEILNMVGQRMYSSEFNGQSTLDVSSFPSGMYIVRINSDDSVLTMQRFIKE